MQTNHTDKDISRREWLRLLSHADPEDLQKEYMKRQKAVNVQYIVPPETGLLMVQGKEDGASKRFHVGEISVTKCVVAIEKKYIGYGMVTGPDHEHARMSALLDGLLQHPDYQDSLKKKLLRTLAEKHEKEIRKIQKAAADTRVNFFTLKRGE